MSLSLGESVDAALFGAPLGSGGQVLALSATKTVSTELTEGIYKLCATEDCWAKQGGSEVDVAEATAPAELVPAGQVRYFAVTAPATNGSVAVIQSAGAGGSASITRADRR